MTKNKSLDGYEGGQKRESNDDDGFMMRRSYDIKGAHDVSYLDISQLKLASKITLGSETDLQVQPDTHIPSADKIDSEDLMRILQDFRAQSMQNQEEDPGTRVQLPTFLRRFVGESIFHGEYGVEPVPSAEMLPRKQGEFDALSQKSSTMRGEKKCKTFLKTSKRNLSGNRRGYYSEVISPYIRPERIIHNRKLEEEKMMKALPEEREEEGEGGLVPEAGEADAEKASGGTPCL